MGKAPEGMQCVSFPLCSSFFSDVVAGLSTHKPLTLNQPTFLKKPVAPCRLALSLKGQAGTFKKRDAGQLRLPILSELRPLLYPRTNDPLHIARRRSAVFTGVIEPIRQGTMVPRLLNE
jgi:hypothetical protein